MIFYPFTGKFYLFVGNSEMRVCKRFISGICITFENHDFELYCLADLMFLNIESSIVFSEKKIIHYKSILREQVIVFPFQCSCMRHFLVVKPMQSKSLPVAVRYWYKYDIMRNFIPSQSSYKLNGYLKKRNTERPVQKINILPNVTTSRQ